MNVQGTQAAQAAGTEVPAQVKEDCSQGCVTTSSVDTLDGSAVGCTAGCVSSIPGLAPGDVPAGMNFISCSDGCGQIWSNADGGMTDVTKIYAGVGVAAVTPAAIGVAATGSVTAVVTAETYGIPATAITIWLLQDSNSTNLYRIWNWVYCQTTGSC